MTCTAASAGHLSQRAHCCSYPSHAARPAHHRLRVLHSQARACRNQPVAMKPIQASGPPAFSGNGNGSERGPFARRRPNPASQPQGDREMGLHAPGRNVCMHAANKVSEPASAQGATTLVAQLCIAGCALLWGTYAPALRLAYSSPSPPDPAVVTAVRAVIQAAILYALLQLQTNDQGKLDEEADGDEGMAQGPPLDQPDVPQPLWSVRQLLTSTSTSFWVMGAELGFWNFAATVAQAEGLEFTSATRGSFLMSVTALVTPALAIASGESTTRSTFIASFMALAGVGLIVLDDTAGVPGISPSNQTIGDVCILLSACFYSLLTVRIGRYAQQAAPVRLASSKSSALAAIALATLAVVAAQRALAGASVASLWGNPFDLVALSAIIWAALGPGAGAAFLQSKGQGSVPASQAQVILTSVPLWSALFAAWLVPGESMGPLAWAGGATLLSAALVAVISKDE